MNKQKFNVQIDPKLSKLAFEQKDCCTHAEVRVAASSAMKEAIEQHS